MQTGSRLGGDWKGTGNRFDAEMKQYGNILDAEWNTENNPLLLVALIAVQLAAVT